MTNPDEPDAQSGTQPGAVSPPARMLLRVVYIMAIILVLLFLALVGGIIWKSTRKAEPRSEVPLASLSLGLPSGTDLRQVAIDGDRLVIMAGQELVVVDIKKNVVTARIRLGP